MITKFKGLTLQSTINDSTYYHSEKNNAKSDPISDQVVATHTSDVRGKKKLTDTDTSNKNSQPKLLINRLIPRIIPVFIPPINQTTADRVSASGGNWHAVNTILSKGDYQGRCAQCCAFFKDPPVVKWKGTDSMVLQTRDTAVTPPPRLTTPVWIGDGPSVSLTSISNQDIESPMCYVVTQEVRNAKPFDTSINRIYVKHRDVYSRC